MSARDLVHWAVMQRVGAERIITADTDFDRLPGVERLSAAAGTSMAHTHHGN